VAQHFDVFRRESERDVIWVGAVETLEQAHKRAVEEMRSKSCSCLIVNIFTGEQHVISLGADAISKT
jgi:hypothetical protein